MFANIKPRLVFMRPGLFIFWQEILFESFFKMLSASTSFTIAVISSTASSVSLLKIAFSSTLKPVVFPVVSFSVCFYKRCISKLQLTRSYGVQFAADGIVVYQFFVPGVIGQLH